MLLHLFAYFIALCSAHSRWVYPPKRPGENNQFGGVKTGPCGGYAPSSSRTVLTPGWHTLEWEETISHSGAPWRISLGKSGGDESSFEECILLNHVPHNDDANTPQVYKINVYIPDVQCDHCVIQLANPMTDKIAPASYCLYDKTKLEACNYGPSCEAGVCFSNYHSCADVTITGTQPRDSFTCSQRTEWPFRVGSGVQLPCSNAASCRSPAQTTRDDYTQIAVQWTNGWISDARVPAIFSQENIPTGLPETTNGVDDSLSGGGLQGVTRPPENIVKDGTTAGVIMAIVALILTFALLWYFQDSIRDFMNDGESSGRKTTAAKSAAISIQIPQHSDWYYAVNGNSSGPLSQTDFEKQLGKSIQEDTLIWNDSMPEWLPAKEVDGVKKMINSQKQVSKASPPPRVAPPVPPSWRQPSGTKQVGDPETADVQWQFVNGGADAVPIAERDLIALNLPADTYVWNGINVTEWTYIQHTYLWQWNSNAME